MPVDLITKGDIQQFCFREDLARATQRTYLRHCKMLFRWLEREEWIDQNVCEPIRHLTRTKNGEQRVVPIRSAYLPYLKAWHRLCSRPDEGLVFFKSDAPGRHTGKKCPLGEDHVSKVYKEYVRAAGLPESVCFHGLRHTCGTQLLRRGMDLHEVASWLGHSSLDSVQTYSTSTIRT